MKKNNNKQTNNVDIDKLLFSHFLFFDILGKKDDEKMKIFLIIFFVYFIRLYYRW